MPQPRDLSLQPAKNSVGTGVFGVQGNTQKIILRLQRRQRERAANRRALKYLTCEQAENPAQIESRVFLIIANTEILMNDIQDQLF